MIKKLVVENYRSIRELKIELGPMNAFIGPNNAGKSNILSALDVILGDKYPTVRSFSEKDFHNYDTSKQIKFEVIFDRHLECDQRVCGFRLTADLQTCEYIAIDQEGQPVKYGQSSNPVRVSNDMKNEVALMYLGLDRQATQQIRPSQWTLYGKLIKHIESHIDSTNKEKFKRTLDASFESEIKPDLEKAEEILRNYVRRQTGLELMLRFSITDPIEIIKNVRPYLRERDSSMEFDAEDMGAGTQSALAVAVAKAYAEIVRKPLVIAMEEPELYLHPHACRNFYNLLKELSVGGVQVIYTTHERSFVNIADFNNIYITRKENGQTKVFSGRGKDLDLTEPDRFKIISKFDEAVNEVFFANAVVLVEGATDKIACSLALENLGIRLDEQGISIIECNSNTAIQDIAKILEMFNIPFYILIDQDSGNQRSEQLIQQLVQVFGSDRILLQSPNLEGMLNIDKLSRAEALIKLPAWFSNNKIPKVYKKLANMINSVSKHDKFRG